MKYVKATNKLNPKVKWVRVHEHSSYGLDSSIGRSDTDSRCKYTSRELSKYSECYSFPDVFIVPYIPKLPFFSAHIETEQINCSDDGYNISVGLDVSTWREIHASRNIGPGMSGGLDFPKGYKNAVNEIERYALAG